VGSCAGINVRSETALQKNQRRLVLQRDLLAQFEDARLPVLLRIEPWKRGGEIRVVLAARNRMAHQQTLLIKQ
jgi:hypothetical protein